MNRLFRSFSLACLAGLAGLMSLSAASRPNILWITSEDNGPQLGCYGDAMATTPHLDALAARGTLYLSAWSCAPVCAPARTAIISGVYPPALGAQHMRSMAPLPSGMKLYPQFLREAGYYCTNNSKEDYNLPKPPGVWDESSTKAHWRNRSAGQPFFAIFNSTTTHESQIRRRPHAAVLDPGAVRVPAYHPDTPEVRRDWAQYYDKMTEMDAQAGAILRALDEDGLTGDTIVFYYGDHGPGMPRSKRWPYQSGLHVPLMVHLPAKFQSLGAPDNAPGARSGRLINFVDLAPTVLSLAGIEPPHWMQGRAFLGQFATSPPEFSHGFRDRMDERYDLVRSVTDGRFVYLRHYLPHKIYGQHIAYMFETPTTRVWKDLYDQGRLDAVQARFWQTKPAEELYDLETDPDEVHNLVQSPPHQAVLERLRQAQREQVFAIRDLGFLPENEIHQRSQGSTPYEMGRDPARYPLAQILSAAELASSLRPEALPELRFLLDAPDSAVRYWAALGLLMRGAGAVERHSAALRARLEDPASAVRIAVAEALGRYGEESDAGRALEVLLRHASLEHNDVWTCMMALNAIEAMGPRAEQAHPQIALLPNQGGGAHSRFNGYVPRLLEGFRRVPSPAGSDSP